jgi:hypothetical protein
MDFTGIMTLTFIIRLRVNPFFLRHILTLSNLQASHPIHNYLRALEIEKLWQTNDLPNIKHPLRDFVCAVIVNSDCPSPL